MELIKSPLNYTGNKFRILPQIQPYFPKEIDTMVDLFCGGATVSINTSCKNRICIDNNDKVVGLLEYLSESQFEKIKNKMFNIAQQYNLSNSFVNGFKYYKKLCKDKNDNNGLSFNNTKNYIFRRTEEAFNCFAKSGYSEDDILELQKNFIINSIDKNKQDVLKMDYAYLHSFCFQYKDVDFNKLYKSSSITDKQELHNYVLNNLNASNRRCILSHKFEDSGNYTVKMMQDSAMILYLTKKIINKKCTDFDTFIYGLFGAYSELYNINKSMLNKFITAEDNYSVFKRVFDVLYDVSQEIAVTDLDVRCINIDDKGDFDTTDESGAKDNEAFSEALKKLVKINSNYKCIMEEIERCKYFTSKESNQHYLEIHHFIPRAFSNDFNNSIEIKDNYIPLCPNCHRKIHLAVDSERKHLINYIYSKRIDKLKENGLIPENEKIDNKEFLKILYEYYNVTE